VALTRSTPATAHASNPVQRHRLAHALEIVGAVVLGDEQTGDLLMHPSRHYDTAGTSHCLCSGRNIRHIPEYLSSRIDHHGA